MLLAVLFSLSRGGILTMLLVALLLLVILPFSKRWKLGFLALFAVLIAGYGSLLGLDLLFARFGSLDNSGAVRLQLYLASLPMLAEHWLTGIGLGSYTLLSPVYLKGFPAHILFDRVHNEYLELLIELGIPAASLLFIWMLVGMGRLATGLISSTGRQVNDPAARDRLILGTAAFCGLIGFFIHGMVDFGWRLPANLVYATTLLAICVTSIERQPIAATASGPGPSPDQENCEDDTSPKDHQ
jgi:O-antigen ligase